MAPTGRNFLSCPGRESTEGITKLCIVPDGQLWKVPFQALVSPEGKFLLERFTVTCSPSLSHWARAALSTQSTSPTGGPPLSGVLAVGDPLAPGTGLKTLPDSGQEAAALVKLYGAGPSRAFIGAEAEEGQVRAAMADYGVLHFATHGRLDDFEPMYSALVLSGSGQGSDDDGLLEAWEVAGLRLRARLAVLSACDTAGGKVRNGEGLVGMGLPGREREDDRGQPVCRGFGSDPGADDQVSP